MYDREKIEKTGKIMEKKYHLGVFLSLTMGGGIAALSGFKPNFRGGGIRAGIN